MKERVLFLCSHNSARSQMAEGLLRHMYGDRFDVESAGIEATGIHPLAKEVMKEAGIDISKQWSKTVNELSDKPFDMVVTVCEGARSMCPVFPGGATRLMHQSFQDPAAFEGSPEEELSAFRASRDEITQWIKKNFGPHEE
jgi:arsenate reductase